jgi:peroxiredoxin
MPCKSEGLTLSKALANLSPKTRVYGVSFEERDKVMPWVKENGIEFPVLLDKGGRLFSGLRLTAFPAKVLLREGMIVKTWFGTSPNEAVLLREVDE